MSLIFANRFHSNLHILKKNLCFACLILILYYSYLRNGSSEGSEDRPKFSILQPYESLNISKKLLRKYIALDAELIQSELNLNDMEWIRRMNSDVLPANSHFGTNATKTYDICRNEEAHLCVKKMRNMETRLRIAAPYKMVACIIQKSMSTVLQAIICYLNNEERFITANRVFSREYSTARHAYTLFFIRSLRFCQWNNEYNGEYNDENLWRIMDINHKNWTFVTIVRDPLDRFLSGFVDKCIRKPHDKGSYCNECGANMTCFIMTEYQKMIEEGQYEFISRDFEDRHFFPQSWRCSFNTEFHRYHIIKYTNTYETHPTYLDDLFKIFRQQNVPESSLDFIKKQMSEARTIHTTITTEARRFLEDRLTKSPFLMEFIIRMFYYDYVMFGFDMPEIYKSR